MSNSKHGELYTASTRTTRLTRCLQIDSAESANRPSAIGPDLEPRYLPLYRAMRESLNDEGYALGCDVEDKLLSTDIRLYVSLDVDSLLEYVQQAKKARAPIGFLLDLDYVEKLWFCPNDGMVSVEDTLKIYRSMLTW